MGCSCSSNNKSKDLILNFEGQQPSESDSVIWSRVESILQCTPQILCQLQVYRGAVCEIKNAISKPQVDECQNKAWAAVLPLVAQLKTYFDFSHTLGQTFALLVQRLCSSGHDPIDLHENISRSPILIKQLALLMDFALKFDDLKMTNAAIQNDFSYYRRTLSRIQLSSENVAVDSQLDVDIDIANRMALFYAHPMPMLNAIIDNTTWLVVQAYSPMFNCAVALICLLIDACLNTVGNKNKCSDENTILCLRVMVAMIVVYDHIHPVGAFDKTTPFNIQLCIKAVKLRAAGQTECLLNILRYSTKHLNSSSTRKAVRALLAPQ